MNDEDTFFGQDMSDSEYRQRIQRERESEAYYANIRKNETKRTSSDSSPYRFSSDDDDSYLSY